MYPSATVDAIREWWRAVGYCEIVGDLAGLACVYLYGRENMWAWPLGLVNCALWVFMFYDAKLYSDVVLQIVFFVLTAVGWYQWVFGGPERTELRIAPEVSLTERLVLVIMAQSLALSAAWYFSKHTDAALPYWDAVILAYSLLAQWLLNKKVLGNWLFWIAIDVLAVAVYAARGLYPTAVLYFVFLLLATKGYIKWRRTLNKPTAAQAA